MRERYRYFTCNLEHRLADALLALVVLWGGCNMLVWLIVRN
jgi:hypothetical protein